MMPVDDGEGPFNYGGEPPLQARLDRGTLTGCLGILCVLMLPLILFLPVEAWNLPPWMLALVPLFGVGMAALGAWLLSRVPTRAAARSTDPLHPLTSGGLPPVLERPALRPNRVALVMVGALLLIGAVGYMVVAFGSTEVAILIGTVLASLAGASLLLYGVLAVRGQLPAPAWRWLRQPIQGGLVVQAVPLLFVGLVMLAWAVLIAAGQGYLWAPIGIGAVILGCALLGPVTQRLPSPRSRVSPRSRR